MNRKALFLSALLGLALAGCNNVGGSEEVIARIGDETVYAEDLDLAVKLDPEGRPQVDRIASELFAKSAFVSKAVAEHPELESQWKAYSKSLETRLLTVVYQRFFATECLLFPESELRSYFELHKADFADSTGSVEFLDVRGKVAEALLLSRSAEALAAANNDTIVMVADDATQAAYAKIPADKTVTVDLNGKTITSTSGGFDVYGTLTIADSSANQTGKIIAARQGVYVDKGGSVTMTAGNSSYSRSGQSPRASHVTVGVSPPRASASA